MVQRPNKHKNIQPYAVELLRVDVCVSGVARAWARAAGEVGRHCPAAVRARAAEAPAGGAAAAVAGAGAVGAAAGAGADAAAFRPDSTMLWVAHQTAHQGA